MTDLDDIGGAALDGQMVAVDTRVAVLANPTAGDGRGPDLVPAILERLGAAGHGVRVLAARTGAQAERACRAAVADGATAMVAVGGDGTVHRALQAVAGRPVAFGVVPAGTGNDFAREVGLPTTALAAADAIATALAQGTTRAVDLARISGPEGVRWFGAVLAAGFDAIVNERANRMRFPRGPVRYDLAILIELARLRPRRYTLRLDGEPQQLEAVLVAIGNTASYGGGLRICPEADPTDGLLDVVIGGRIGRASVVLLKPGVRRGTHLAHPRVRTYRAREVTLEAEGIVGYADGERYGPLPVRVTSVPGALRLLAPAGSGPAS